MIITDAYIAYVLVTDIHMSVTDVYIVYMMVTSVYTSVTDSTVWLYFDAN